MIKQIIIHLDLPEVPILLRIMEFWNRIMLWEAGNDIVRKLWNLHFLIPYGYGDGGGGTTRDMIEKGKENGKRNSRLSAGEVFR